MDAIKWLSLNRLDTGNRWLFQVLSKSWDVRGEAFRRPGPGFRSSIVLALMVESAERKRKKRVDWSTLFYASNVSLAGKSPWQSLAAHHRRQALLPLGAPVHSAMGGFRLTGCSACSISLIFASLLIRLGISATAALDSIEFAACREMLALVTTGQMSIDSEMDNHRTPP